MKSGFIKALTVICSTLMFLIATSDCVAVEGGLGHSAPGLWGGPKIGVVPTDPGIHFVNYVIGYKGSELVHQVAMSGMIAEEVRASLLIDYVSGIFIPKKQAVGRTYGYSIAIPADFVTASAQVVQGGPIGRQSGEMLDLGDIIVTPVLLGWKNGSTYSAFRLLIFTKTGHFQTGVIGLTGDNTWTISPMFAQTFEHLKNWDLSYNAGLDFYTKNKATDYQNGIVFHVDISAVKQLSSLWGIGLIFGWLDQLNDDTGPLADQLGGFRGHDIGLGPIATYDFRSRDREVSMNFRVVKEFEARNRLAGWTLLWVTGFKW